MKYPAPTNNPNRWGRPAFSLLEVVISLFLVGTVMVVALQAFVAATTGRIRNGNQARAVLLAQALVDEILDQPYTDPDAIAGVAGFGPENGETVGQTRALFDDIDDYHLWSASPPEDKDGTDLPVSADWSRQVSVRWVSAQDIELSADTDEGLKEVLVTVKHKDLPAASLAVVVTQARQVLPLQVP